MTLISEMQFRWGVLPATLTLLCAGTSIFISNKTRRALDYLFSTLILLLSSFSLWYLLRIFIANNYPTFIPHIVIVAVILIVSTQLMLLKK